MTTKFSSIVATTIRPSRPVIVWVRDERAHHLTVSEWGPTYDGEDMPLGTHEVPVPKGDQLTPDGVDTQAHVESLSCDESKVELERYIANRSYLRGLLRHREKERDKAKAERDALREALEQITLTSKDGENTIHVEQDFDFGVRQGWRAAAVIAREALAALEGEVK